MSLAFIYPVVSRISLPKYFLRLKIYFLSSLFICSSNLYGQSLSAVQIYKKVTNAVVVIRTYDYNNKLTNQGSGVVLNDRGYVVTNYHVLAGNKRIELLHGKEIVPYVDIIGIDVEKDILILKINSKKFSSVKIGNSKTLDIGQRVYAIGSPMGLENSISEGIISGLRSYDDLSRNFIQITASISPGSSGGAVINDKGELIGISTLTLKEGQNLNFAIPIDDILKVKIDSYSKNDIYKNFELFKYGFDANEAGDYSESIRYYSLFLKIYPNYPNVYNNRGLAKFNLKIYRDAIQDFDIAIEMNSSYSEAYCNRGLSKSNLKDYIEAIQDFNKAIELNPKHAAAYNNRGLAKIILGDKYGACLDWSKAGELGLTDAYDIIKKFCK